MITGNNGDKCIIIHVFIIAEKLSFLIYKFRGLSRFLIIPPGKEYIHQAIHLYKQNKTALS
jgi:hypothetical protein